MSLVASKMHEFISKKVEICFNHVGILMLSYLKNSKCMFETEKKKFEQTPQIASVWCAFNSASGDSYSIDLELSNSILEETIECLARNSDGERIYKPCSPQRIGDECSRFELNSYAANWKACATEAFTFSHQKPIVVV